MAGKSECAWSTAKVREMSGGTVWPEHLKALSNTEVSKNRLAEPTRQFFQTCVLGYASTFSGQTTPPDDLFRLLR